jgi:hypothetical protein
MFTIYIPYDMIFQFREEDRNKNKGEEMEIFIGILIGIFVPFIFYGADKVSEGIKEKYRAVGCTADDKKYDEELMRPKTCPDCGKLMVYKNNAQHCYSCDCHVNADCLKLDEFCKTIDWNKVPFEK